jgi:hypothetical protein
MNKIYALFSSQNGDGTRCLFITSLQGEELRKAQTIVNTYTKIGHASFFIGEADPTSLGNWADMSDFTWTIPGLGDAKVNCDRFPIFR